MDLTVILPLLFVLLASIAKAAPLPIVIVEARGIQRPLTLTIPNDAGIHSTDVARIADPDLGAVANPSPDSRPIILVLNIGSGNTAEQHSAEAGKAYRPQGSSWKWTRRTLWVLAILGLLGAIVGEEKDIAKEKRDKKNDDGAGDIHLDIEELDEKAPLSIRAEEGDKQRGKPGWEA